MAVNDTFWSGQQNTWFFWDYAFNGAYIHYSARSFKNNEEKDEGGTEARAMDEKAPPPVNPSSYFGRILPWGDKLIGEFGWAPISFDQDSSIAGYIFCPVYTKQYLIDDTTEMIEYYSIPVDAPSQFIGSVTRHRGIDSSGFINPPPPPDDAHHIVNPSPIKRPVFHWKIEDPTITGTWVDVKTIDLSGNESDWSGWYWISTGRFFGKETGVKEEGKLIPFGIRRIINPVKGKIDIIFGIPRKTMVEINILDISGRISKRLMSETVEKGIHVRSFELGLPSGVYFVQIKAGDKQEIKKLVLLR